MEDIRQYLDETRGYHKGETQGVAIFAGLVFLVTAAYFILHGGFFLLWYGSAFEEASGALDIGAPGSLQGWLMCAFRPALGFFFAWLGLMAWDSRRGFLYWAWVVVPAYLYFWGSYLLMLDPEFRAAELAPGNLFTYPSGFILLGTMLFMLLVLVAVTLGGYAFKASAEDHQPVIVVAVVAVLWFGCSTYVSEVDPICVDTAMVHGIHPLHHRGSGIPTLKLIALSQEALVCHKNMDELRDGLARLERTGRSIKYSAYDNRPGGERLVRMLQQSAKVPVPLDCPGAGWYRVLKEVGTWRCSEHGDRLPMSERRVGGSDLEEDSDLQPGL